MGGYLSAHGMAATGWWVKLNTGMKGVNDHSITPCPSMLPEEPVGNAGTAAAGVTSRS